MASPNSKAHRPNPLPDTDLHRCGGGVVLDATIGSGTTAVAALMEKRHFVGFELNKEYFDKAVKRVEAEKAQLTLF